MLGTKKGWHLLQYVSNTGKKTYRDTLTKVKINPLPTPPPPARQVMTTLLISLEHFKNLSPWSIS